jgi:hypothetical protein
MMSRVRNPLVVSCVFLWVGFVCAISFMEAWLKFQAPGVTLPIGLGIGRLVFNALNQIEWVFAIVIVLNFVLRRIRKANNKMVFLVIPLMILTIQTLELLPALDARATQVIKGEFTEPSVTHTVYIILEAVKVISLVVFGSTLFLQPRFKVPSTEPQH